MKMVLCAVLLGGVLLLRGRYSSFLRCSEQQLREFRDLILHIERRLETFPCAQEELLDGYSSAKLEQAGFFSNFKKTKTLREAYNLTRPGLSLPKNAELALLECFRRFGGGYLEEELKMLRIERQALEGILLTLGEENEKRLKLFSAIGLSLALGIGLIFI